jgi:putative ABC transport system ATP-binding protein
MDEPGAPPLFELRDVSVEIDDRLALASVSCSIPPDGITVVLGPSGSGKSTLLRLCNRLAVPTSGSVRYRGDDLDTLDPLALRRAVGMVFQRPTPFRGTVRENLAVAVADADDASMTEVLERVHLGGSFLERQAQELSGGEAQRACLARTLLTEPAVLLLDEPTSALDVDSRFAFEGVVRRLAEAGTSVVWVTHDLEQAGRVGDRSIVLIEGRIRSEAEARAYREHQPESRERSAEDGDN